MFIPVLCVWLASHIAHSSCQVPEEHDHVHEDEDIGGNADGHCPCGLYTLIPPSSALSRSHMVDTGSGLDSLDGEMPCTKARQVLSDLMMLICSSGF